MSGVSKRAIDGRNNLILFLVQNGVVGSIVSRSNVNRLNPLVEHKPLRSSSLFRYQRSSSETSRSLRWNSEINAAAQRFVVQTSGLSRLHVLRANNTSDQRQFWTEIILNYCDGRMARSKRRSSLLQLKYCPCLHRSLLCRQMTPFDPVRRQTITGDSIQSVSRTVARGQSVQTMGTAEQH